jgi:putative ABC transport system permease protein
MIRSFNQIAAITAANLRSIPDRLGLSLVIVVGIAGVAAVLVSLLAMRQGLDQTLGGTGKRDRMIMMRASSDGELSSILTTDIGDIVKRFEGIAKDASGQPIASNEVVVITELPTESSEDTGVNVTMRGVEAMAFTLRPEVRLMEGTRFTPGLREVIVGKKAQQSFKGTGLGSVLRFRGADWKVVGVFESNDSHESELWADLGTLQTSFSRGNATSSLVAQLDSASSLELIKQAAASDPRLKVDVLSERKYYSDQSDRSSRPIVALTGIVAFFMVLAALFAALNTMFAAISVRAKEIATLRAIGFGGLPVMCSVIVESMLLALLGGIVGAALAYLLFNGATISTLSSNFTQVAFSFQVSPRLVVIGLTIALVIGFLGGLLPAFMAVRRNIPQALRAG